MSIQITGSGFYLPPYIENSKTTAQIIRKNENWIISKTGVKERRISKIDVDKMGAIAAEKALDGNGAPDLIINGSNGYVSTTFSSNELSRLIVSIIKNTSPSDLSQCSRNSALTVDWSSVAAQHWSLVYKPLLIQ